MSPLYVYSIKLYPTIVTWKSNNKTWTLWKDSWEFGNFGKCPSRTVVWQTSTTTHVCTSPTTELSACGKHCISLLNDELENNYQLPAQLKDPCCCTPSTVCGVLMCRHIEGAEEGSKSFHSPLTCRVTVLWRVNRPPQFPALKVRRQNVCWWRESSWVSKPSALVNSRADSQA